MLRREFCLVSVGAVTLLAGCDESDNGERTERPSPVPADDVHPDTQYVELYNRDERDRRVRVRISRDDRDVITGEYTLTHGERKFVPVAFPDTESYTVSVTLSDGGATTFPLTVEAFDRENGSNIIVEIHDGEPAVFVEE